MDFEALVSMLPTISSGHELDLGDLLVLVPMPHIPVPRAPIAVSASMICEAHVGLPLGSADMGPNGFAPCCYSLDLIARGDWHKLRKSPILCLSFKL